MQRRCSILVATLFLIAASLLAESPGAHELGLGKEALAHRDFRAAAEHFAAATEGLDPQGEREALADAWLQLGVVDLTGLDHASDALAAFRKSAELAASPSSAWLWAATAAEKLGRPAEAEDLKARALAPPPAPEPPAAPEVVQAKAAAPAPAPTPETVQAKAPAPEPVQAAPPPVAPDKAPAAAPVEAAKPAPAQAPSAFQHFFGPKERKAPPAPPPPPAAAPAPAASASSSTTTLPSAAPAAAPAAASPSAPAPKEGAAFQHLFGENRPARPAGAREAQAEGPEARKAKEEKAKSAPGAPSHLDALEILFGEKKKVVKKGDEKPPEPKKQDGTPQQVFRKL